ncbi:hypothetical protein ABUW04_38305 [Streptacidiphilus sp. N1-10]|uniref:Lipoprotein n=1 Tax=Streptacidiphilus jeojiensis TaxID=3229225 RepID=A0ABV6Y1J0_9ACTN
MARRNGYRTAAGAAAAAVLAGAVLTGCGSSGAASSAVSAAQSAASGLASSARDALASASAAASSALARVKDGVDAKGDVSLGSPSTGSDGRTAVEVTVKNSDSSAHDYTVTVNFRDSGGNLLDAGVLNIDNVAAGGTGTGTVHSNRALSGTVTAEVGAALRH